MLPFLLFSLFSGMFLVSLVAFLNAHLTVAVDLVRCMRRVMDREQCHRRHVIADPSTFLKTDTAREIRSSACGQHVLQIPPWSARYITLVGWLCSPHQTLHQALRSSSRPTTQLSGTCSQEGSTVLTHTAHSIPTSFQSLPTEIHFQIAAYLPGHAIAVLARSDTLSESLRHTYKKADPRRKGTSLSSLSREESCIWLELRSRDLFEKTPYPREVEGLVGISRYIWSGSRFYCFCCKKSVGFAHFPVKQMLESVNHRTGMGKITERRCFAYVMPIQLWGEKVITWDRLQEARAKVDPANPSVLLEWDLHHTTGQLQGGKTCHPSRPSRLSLDYVLPETCEATAKYFIDLYTPLRFRASSASIITELVKQSPPYICPHLDLSSLLHRLMGTKPIDSRPQTLSYSPELTVAEVLVAALDKKPWATDPDSYQRRPDKPLRKIKEQAIRCGFRGGKCRTSVTLQRFRDNEEWSLGWMKDLVRLKVVRKWRVDKGTGDAEWQAQNGVSVQARLNVVRKEWGDGGGKEVRCKSGF